MTNASFEGNLTRDPELRFTQTGKAVADFSVAVNRTWNDANGERQEEVSFFDCSAWDQLAHNIADSLVKGDRVVVTARMRQRSWDAEDGTKRSKIEFTVDGIGPSLRWATAKVTKNEKHADGGATPARATADASPAGADYIEGGEPF